LLGSKNFPDPAPFDKLRMIKGNFNYPISMAFYHRTSDMKHLFTIKDFNVREEIMNG
jgi:hypothetical protein